jgi:TraL protein
MKIIVHTFILLSLWSIASVQAATCRSGSAAAQGGQSGYLRDKQAAEQTAQSDRSSSDILGKCVGGITAVLTAPQFPSLSEIFDQVKDKVCRIASDQINGAVNDVNGQVNGVMNHINGQISNTGVGQVVSTMPQISGPSLQQTSGNSSQSSAFWSNIWK